MTAAVDAGAEVERPNSITALAVITAVLSASALFLIPGSLAISFYLPGPVREITRTNDFFRIWLLGSAAVGWVACFAAITGAVGLFLMKKWARLLMLAWAVYAVFSTIVGALVTMTILLPALLQYDGPERSGALGGAAGGLMGSVISLILPAAHHWILTRPHIKAAFDRSAETR